MLQTGWGKERARDLPASCFTPLRKNFKAKFSNSTLGEQVLLPALNWELGFSILFVTPAWPGLSYGHR